MKFARLIKKHSSKIEITKETPGHKEGPNWVPGTKNNYLVDAAVFNMSPEELEKYEGGKYTVQDLKIKVVEGYEMTNKDTEQVEDVMIEQGDKISWQDNTYTVDEIDPRTNHADFYTIIAVKEVVDDD